MEKLAIVLGTPTDESITLLNQQKIKAIYDPSMEYVDLCNKTIMEQKAEILGFSTRELFLHVDKTYIEYQFKILELIGGIYFDQAIITPKGTIINYYPSFNIQNQIDPVIFLNGRLRTEIFDKNYKNSSEILNKVSSVAPVLHISRCAISVRAK